MKQIFIAIILALLFSCQDNHSMDDIVQIEILDKSGHDDLKFCVKDLTSNLTFDTYYFGLATNPYENFQDLRECIAHFLKIWVAQLGQMKNGQTKYFPIDISDQYTGCLKITKQQDKLEIGYGTSLTEGWSVDLLNPTQYYDSITDFHSDVPKTIVVTQADFLNSLNNQITELTN